MTETSAVTPHAQSLGFDPVRLGRIDSWMRQHVQEGRLPMTAVRIMRHGEIAFDGCTGMADVEDNRPITSDALYRIYSMSKPVTALAALMLYEEGAFQLDQPVADFIPSFAQLEVVSTLSEDGYTTEPLNEPVTLHHLFTHTSGLIYGDPKGSVLERTYSARNLAFADKAETLADAVARLMELPLAHQPGKRWSYGVSTDVLGRVIEIIAGKAFGDVLQERIFGPLGMVDTGFAVPEDKRDRLTALYTKSRKRDLGRAEGSADSAFCTPVAMQSGGGGLISTMADYSRFTEMLRRRGITENGERLLGRKTFDLMVANHMPGDLASMGQPHFSETTMEGIGFGLCGHVMLDPAKAKILGSPGEFGWGGVASTAFWVDPVEDMTVLFMTQLIPSSAYTLRRQLRVLSYQALID